MPRVLPENTQAVIHADSWTRPAVFDWLQEAGNIDSHEMHRVFNNGIGMVVIVDAADAERAMQAFKAEGEKVFRLGEIVERPQDAPGCIVI